MLLLADKHKFNTIITMKLKSCLKEMIKTCDLFSVSQFLRYKQDDSYMTVSGGIVSIVVVAVFIIFFASNAIDTINKTTIFW